MPHQKILIMQTGRSSIRATADGWTYEDSSNIQPNQSQYPYIGIANNTKSFEKLYPFHCFDCPLRAMANGWRLMAPPQEFKCKNGDGEEIIVYEWWFEKFE